MYINNVVLQAKYKLNELYFPFWLTQNTYFTYAQDVCLYHLNINMKNKLKKKKQKNEPKYHSFFEFV